MAGELTLADIIQELKKPGRDPRASFEPPSFREDILSIEDLKLGMRLEGVVTNVTAFGAFVDIGVHQDGLIHLSELSDKYIKHPSEVVKAGDKIQVKVSFSLIFPDGGSRSQQGRGKGGRAFRRKIQAKRTCQSQKRGEASPIFNQIPFHRCNIRKSWQMGEDNLECGNLLPLFLSSTCRGSQSGHRQVDANEKR